METKVTNNSQPTTNDGSQIAEEKGHEIQERGEEARKVPAPQREGNSGSGAYLHRELAAGRWHTLSLMEQLGNVGSEVGRTRSSWGNDEARSRLAAERALELFDLTLDDPRWRGPAFTEVTAGKPDFARQSADYAGRGRRQEIARAREVFCDTVWNSGALFGATLEELERYFYPFAYATRLPTGPASPELQRGEQTGLHTGA